MNQFHRPYLSISLVVLLGGCSSSGGDDDPAANRESIPAEKEDYVAFAWNDLGMHCLNPTYDTAVLLPPYNNLFVQVVKRGNPPQLMTQGISVSYFLINNTTSQGKSDAYGGDFDQFWAESLALFGVALEDDTGLNLVDPTLHNGLEGSMVADGDHFEANGLPVVPVLDDGTWNPYQVAQLVISDASGQELVKTRATVPTSDEINCAKCHAKNGVATEEIGGGTSNVFANILALHDESNETSLATETPVLCAQCHGSPALGAMEPGEGGYLSQVIHALHAEEAEEINCYDCHPGSTTHCNRSKAHSADDGNCTTCHGTLSKVGSSIADGSRIPWVDEPQCVSCHEGIAEVQTGSLLYRNATGHGGLYCAACHGSPHAQIPSEQASDEYQALQYQAAAKPIGSCSACHSDSRGGGASEFGEVHGGSNGRASACRVCHTVTPATLTSGPHHFEWQ